jgi:hypothetical protein
MRVNECVSERARECRELVKRLKGGMKRWSDGKS